MLALANLLPLALFLAAILFAEWRVRRKMILAAAGAAVTGSIPASESWSLMRALMADMGGTVLLLFIVIVFFAMLLVFVEYRFKDDAQVFQLIGSQMNNFSGALLGIITKDKLSSARAASQPQPPVNP